MKKHNLLVFSILFVAGLFLSSCSKMFDLDDSKTSLHGNGKILISLGLANPDGTENTQDEIARTIMPYAETNGVGSLSEISFYSKLSSADTYSLLKTWNSVTEMQKSPYSEAVAAGTYDFKLTAKNYGATMVQELKSKVVSSDSTTNLYFTSLSPSPDGAQTGGIYIYADYRDFSSYSHVTEALKDFAMPLNSPYPVYSVKLDSGEVLSSIGSGSETTGSNGGSCEFNSIGTSTYINNAAAAGNHILTYTFTSPNGKVFVYPVAVQVKAGYLSRETIYPLMSTSTATISNQSYTITYNENKGSSSVTATQTFAGNAIIADAQALSFIPADSSMRFKYWTTDAAGNGTRYYSGDTLPLTGNTTLYAQWGVFYTITYFINLDGQVGSYIQAYESGTSLVTAATAFPSFNSSQYIFCGWDTLADGSGTRCEAGTELTITEDTVLYAQWCGRKSSKPLYSDYYTVKNVNEWNALMGSSFANATSGELSVNVYVSANIANPALKHTNTKTFTGKLYAQSVTISGFTNYLFNKIDSDAEINGSGFNVKGPLCKYNYGTISNVTVSNMNMTSFAAIARNNNGTISACTVSGCNFKGGNDYIGAICEYNDEDGIITNCQVLSCTIDGETNSCQYTGGICGQNNGVISGDDTKVTSTIKGCAAGSRNDNVYTGGYCGYNSGSITGTGSIEISLTGSTESNGHLGYVTGYNETNVVNGNSANNPISADITLKDLDGNELEGTEIINKSNDSLTDGYTRTYDTFTVEGNTKVYFYLKDSSGGSNTNKETLELFQIIPETGDTRIKLFISKGTPNIETYLYLNKGSYRIKRTNDNISKTSYMNVKIVAY